MNTIVLIGRLARNRTSKAFVVMITAYGNNAEFVEKYLEKGIKIALSGELVTLRSKMNRLELHPIIPKSLWMMWNLQKPKKKEESDGFQPAEKRKIPFDIPEELEQEMPFR